MKKSISITFILFLFVFVTKVNAQILSVEPDTAILGQTLEIEVTAENMDFTQGTNVVELQHEETKLFLYNSVNSSSSLKLIGFFQPNLPIGNYNLSIKNTILDTTFTKENALYLRASNPDASLKNILPATAMQGENITVTILGSKTNFTKEGAINSIYLKAGSKQINAVVIRPIDSVTLEATFDFSYIHQTGLYSVYVFNIYDGTQILDDVFELLPGENPPSIASVSPDTVRRGELLEIEVTTENFDFQQGTNLISLSQDKTNMPLFKGVTIENQNSIILNCVFNNNYPLGFYNLNIMAPYFGEIVVKKEDALFVQPDLTTASIDSISINKAMQGENITMFIYGTNTNFTKNGSENRVYLGNTMQNIRPFYINPVDSVTLEAHFQFTYKHLSGIYSVYVNNDYDGTQVLTDAFELSGSPDYPSITSVTPDTIVQGQTLDVEVSAENIDFTQGTNVIRLVKDNTQFYMTSLNAISPILLVGTISVSESAPLGDYNLSVWNSSFDITLVADQTIIKENAFYLKSGTVNNNDIKLSEEKYFIFPNPSRDFINLNKEADLLQIFNMDGQLLFEERRTKSIDLTGLKSGTYIVRTTIDKKNYSHILVKNN